MTSEPTVTGRVDEDGRRANTIIEGETCSLLARWDCSETGHDEIEVPPEALAKYGLRKRTNTVNAVPRILDSDEADHPLPPCVIANQSPGPKNPGLYVRARTWLAIETRRFHLCCKNECFGRLAVSLDAPTPELSANSGCAAVGWSD